MCQRGGGEGPLTRRSSTQGVAVASPPVHIMMRAKGVLRWDRICSVALVMKECMDSEYVHQDLRQHT